MLNAEGVQEIVKIGNTKVEEFDGVKFHVNPEGADALKYPKLEKMEAFSLQQMVNFIKAGELGGKALVNVLSEKYVELVYQARGKNREVEVLAAADFSKIFEDFPFGRELVQEDFMIQLMTKFADTEERSALLGLSSSIKAEKISTSQDDGFSQTAAVKSGVHLQTEMKVKNLWKLKTFKTFPEVEQPVIQYILRLHQRGSEVPKFSLHPCDGGAWKIETTRAVRSYLVEQLKDVKDLTVL